jgi:threonine dehydratase/predicted transcriptional regulator
MSKQLLSINQNKVLSLFHSHNRITTNDVVKSVTLPRPTAKQILFRLKDLGLIEQKGLGRASYYTLKQEGEILDPQGKQLVSVYKGMESFRALFDRLAKQLKPGDFYWTFAFKNEYQDSTVKDLLVEFHTKLAKNKIDDRAIFSYEVANIVEESFSGIKNLQSKFTNQDIPIGTIIIKNSVINLVWSKQPVAVIIKAGEIYQRYYQFFQTAWEQAESIDNNEIIKPGNTPVISLKGLFGVKHLWMKDETKNPTHTFKDRLAYEMIRPLYERYLGGKKIPSTTFGSISYGNTAKSMGHYVKLLNKVTNRNGARAVAFVPPFLEKKQFGPDSNGITIPASKVIDNIKDNCNVVPIDLSKQIYRSADLEKLANKHFSIKGDFIDITEGLNRPAYVNIIIEAIEQQLKQTPDYVIVPFGAGILCNEIMDYINEYQLHTKVIPVSSGDPETIAVMLYGPIWVDTKSLLKKGWGLTRHEDPDRKGRKREPYKVYHVSDKELYNAMDILKKQNINAEPSGASGFAILPQLKKIAPAFNPSKHSVLVINTGDGILNYK